MKAVILVGGFGSRLNETTHLIPKLMVEIGGMFIFWHIMKITATTESTASLSTVGLFTADVLCFLGNIGSDDTICEYNTY